MFLINMDFLDEFKYLNCRIEDVQDEVVRWSKSFYLGPRLDFKKTHRIEAVRWSKKGTYVSL